MRGHNRYRFSFESGYMGVAEYTVYGDGEPYRVRVRREASDYERSISSYNDADWERDVVGMIGLLCANLYRREMSPDVAPAFNAWRTAEHNRCRAEIESQPERYGVIDWDNDPMFAAPKPLRGANYRVRWENERAIGLGWEVMPEPEIVEAA